MDESTSKNLSRHISFSEWLQQLKYPWLIAIVFVVATIAILVALLWMTILVIRLERSERESKVRAHLEENIRLALWRIDSALTPLLAQESTRSFNTLLKTQYVKTYFQFGPDGNLLFIGQSGELPLAADSRLRSAEQPLAEKFASIVTRQSILDVMPKKVEVLTQPIFSNSANLSQIYLGQNSMQKSTQNSVTQSNSVATNRSQVEFSQRMGNVFNNSLLVQNYDSMATVLDDTGELLMVPVIISDELLLARRVVRDGQEIIEGCWLDWPNIRLAMEQLISDLLIDGHLELESKQPTNGLIEDGSNLLASLPVVLVASRIQEDGTNVGSDRSNTSTWLLFLTWCGVLSSLLAAALLVIGSIRLGERRAAFVTAVTHELRTPLTTFLMYTEMLTQGMVPEKSDQQRYLKTLRHEALRLEHLVENVLAYAKLERGRSHNPPQELLVVDLMSRTLPYLQQQAELASMEVECSCNPAVILKVLANPNLVEQILLNLVDNACKYAKGSSDPRILLSVQDQGNSVAIHVRDFGPGMPLTGRHTATTSWLRPFHKTAQEAARTSPGVGLGISLCRRLAKQMSGSLEIDSVAGQGTRVTLRLPKVS